VQESDHHTRVRPRVSVAPVRTARKSARLATVDHPAGAGAGGGISV
jgi:hypothetical protein